MAQVIGPSSSWSLESHATNICWTSNGNNFSFIACMVSSALGSVWYLDSGASFHMTGDEELFSDLEEKDLQMHIKMGDDG